TPAAATARGATPGGLRTAARLAHDVLGRTVAVAMMLRDLRRLHPRPDVVHAHNVFPAGLAARRFAHRGVPFVVTEHSSAYLRGQFAPVELAAAERVLSAASEVVAVSPRQAEALPVDGVHVVPNVLPAVFDLREEDAARVGDIVSIGFLMPHKGMDTLVEAYAQLPADLRARHRLVLVGGGPEASRLTALATSLDLGDRVILTGHVSRLRVADIISSAAVLVSASPVETFGMTLIEGLAAGVPFVAVRSGGPQSIWFSGAGHLVETSTPADLAAGIETVLTDDDGDDTTRRATAIERYGAATVAATLSAIYAGAAPTAGGRTPR
ncbi:MAG: glycosyltransferase, partial [Mobilicoccus sp.]|nr:glycosyltransferase [Mobilicoccus sp.]